MAISTSWICWLSAAHRACNFRRPSTPFSTLLPARIRTQPTLHRPLLSAVPLGDCLECFGVASIARLCSIWTTATTRDGERERNNLAKLAMTKGKYAELLWKAKLRQLGHGEVGVPCSKLMKGALYLGIVIKIAGLVWYFFLISNGLSKWVRAEIL